MPAIVVGPLLRHVGRTDATIWVETDEPCEVEALGHGTPTFTVEGHHFAVIVIEGLEPGSEHEYEVLANGCRAWPPADSDLPPPRIRTIGDGGALQLLFGSCRASAPHRPPYTFQRWWHPEGRGIDVLRAYAMRMLRQPSASWPDAVMLMGDQLYADQPPESVQKAVAPRRVHADGPVEVLEDFEEYTVGYREAWTHPLVRWLLSTLPSSMILDDHEINDLWKTSQAWLDEKRRTDWYADRVVGGLMAYWLYQHLGNLSPRELDEDETFAAVRGGGDHSERVRAMATRAESQPGHSRFSFCRDLGPARLIVVDSRVGRELEPGRRKIMSEGEWDWVRERATGDHENVLLASSLPILLPHGMHGLEGWSEAVADGAWGARLAPLGEKARRAANLDHWASFGASFRELERFVGDVANGVYGPPPRSLVMLGGDVHHCWVSEVQAPGDHAATRIWQVVCSGLRKELPAGERFVLQFGHTRVAAAVGRALARSARVPAPVLRWRPVTRPHFRNQIGTLEIAGGEAGVRIERVSGGWRKPRLTTVIEHKLV